jgi:hypothetical protein
MTRRLPIYQIMLHGQPYVCTDEELGAVYTRPLTPTHIWACLGAIWQTRSQPDMVPVIRYTAEAPNGERIWSRLGSESEPDWVREGFRADAQPLGYAFPIGARATADDLVDLEASMLEGSPVNAGYFYDNRIEHYPGVGFWTPKGISSAPGGFRVHKPQVVRVTWDHASREIGMDPDPVQVTAGGGAPIVFLRGNGETADGKHMSWSFADLVLEETSHATAGTTYPSSADFTVRHMTTSEIVVIDDLDVTQPTDTSYRLSIQVHDALPDGRTGVVFSRDPKVRNSTQGGSGGTGGG